MDGSAIERILAFFDTKEPCRLFKCFLAESFDFAQLQARAKQAMLIPVGNRVFGKLVPNTGNVFEKIDGRTVQVYAHPVDARLDRRGKTALQLPLINIVLVLSDTDRLRLGFNKLRQWILQAARNRYCASYGDI